MKFAKSKPWTHKEAFNFNMESQSSSCEETQMPRIGHHEDYTCDPMDSSKSTTHSGEQKTESNYNPASLPYNSTFFSYLNEQVNAPEPSRSGVNSTPIFEALSPFSTSENASDGVFDHQVPLSSLDASVDRETFKSENDNQVPFQNRHNPIRHCTANLRDYSQMIRGEGRTGSPEAITAAVRPLGPKHQTGLCISSKTHANTESIASKSRCIPFRKSCAKVDTHKGLDLSSIISSHFAKLKAEAIDQDFLDRNSLTADQLLRWKYVYNCLSDAQKDELKVDVPPNEEHTEDVLAVAVSKRLKLTGMAIAWEKSKSAVKLRIFCGNAKSGSRLEKQLTVKYGVINAIFCKAANIRDSLRSEAGLPSAKDLPKTFTNPDIFTFLTPTKGHGHSTTTMRTKRKMETVASELENSHSFPSVMAPPRQHARIKQLQSPRRIPVSNERINRIVAADLVKLGFQNCPSTSEIYTDAVVVGAGVAGLAAASYLKRCGVPYYLLEARNRIGGRAFTISFPEKMLKNGTLLPETKIDLGANYMHCCMGDAPDTRKRRETYRSVVGLASELKPLVADVCGGTNWESTLFCRWYNTDEQRPVDNNVVVKINALADRVRIRAARKMAQHQFISSRSRQSQDSCPNYSSFDYHSIPGEASYDADYNSIRTTANDLTPNTTFLDSCGNSCEEYLSANNPYELPHGNFFNNVWNTLSPMCPVPYRWSQPNIVSGINSQFGHVQKNISSFTAVVNTQNQQSEVLVPVLPSEENNTCAAFYNTAYPNDFRRSNLSVPENPSVRSQHHIDWANNIQCFPCPLTNYSNEAVMKTLPSALLDPIYSPTNNVPLNMDMHSNYYWNRPEYLLSDNPLESHNGSKIKPYEISNQPPIISALPSPASSMQFPYLNHYYNSPVNLHLNPYIHPQPSDHLIPQLIANSNPHYISHSTIPVTGNSNDFSKNVSTFMYYGKSFIDEIRNSELKTKNSFEIDAQKQFANSGRLTDTELYDLKTGQRRNLWDFIQEAINEEFNELNLSASNLTEEEWKILMVIFQSRYGYVSRLEETAISVSRIPTVELKGLPPDEKELPQDSVWFSRSLDQAEKIIIEPFSHESASDKIVIDGWQWLVSHLGNLVKDHTYLNSVVNAVSVWVPGCSTVSSDPPEYPVKVSVNHTDNMMSFNDHHGSPKMNMNLRHAPSQSYTIHAKYCLIALPLGVLIDSAHDRCDEIGNIQFYPPLSKAKRASLARYGMGVHNKIVMRFDPGQIFWRQQSPQLNCLDQRYQFLNLHAYGKVGCLLAHCFPPWSQGFGATDSDEMVVSDCCKVLQNMHGLTDEQMPAPVDYIVTRWHKDSFSRGSYSYPQVNSQDDDIFMLRVPSPIQNPRILFAGEYLSRSYYQCVDGAFDTGLRAAETIVHEGLGVPVPERTDNRPLSVDIFGVPDYKCPFTGFPLCKLDDESRCLYLTDGSDEGLSDIEGPDLDYPIEELDDGVVREERMYLTDACEAFRQERPIAFPDYVYHGLKALHFGESTSDTNCSALNGINLFSENISFSQEGDGSESIIEGTAPLPRRSRRLKVKESSSKKVTMSKYMQNLWTNDFCKNESKGITKSTSVGAAIALMEILKNQQGVNELYPVNEFDQKLELNELSGSQHDSLCWACLCGGEVLLCDGEGCRRVWHKDCVSPAPTADELLDGVEWICPACNGSDLPRGFDAAEKELQCYWKKRVWISKIKSNLAMCRKVFRRLAQHNVACVKHSAEAARIDSPLRDVKATGSTTDDLAI